MNAPQYITIRAQVITRSIFFAGLALLCLYLCACSDNPPSNAHNACLIFQEHPKWHAAILRAHKRWGTPQSLQLAIIFAESHFNQHARPGYKATWGMSLFHKTSALGYAQALDATWRLYLLDTRQLAADRENFADSVDFIGWYTHQSKRRLSIPYHNVAAQYLAYHEGWGGYKQGIYLKNKPLLKLSRQVVRLAHHYKRQILTCKY